VNTTVNYGLQVIIFSVVGSLVITKCPTLVEDVDNVECSVCEGTGDPWEL
jgi:hypothetical protein